MAEKHELTIEATIANVEKVIDFVDGLLERLGCSMRSQTQIDIAIDEIFSNICHYAYGKDVGKATIRLEPLEDEHAVRLTFEDEGIAFDPLARVDPDVTLGLHERRIGGLGIFMVKKTMDRLHYVRDGRKNVFSIVKRL